MLKTAGKARTFFSQFKRRVGLKFLRQMYFGVLVCQMKRIYWYNS